MIDKHKFFMRIPGTASYCDAVLFQQKPGRLYWSDCFLRVPIATPIKQVIFESIEEGYHG